MPCTVDRDGPTSFVGEPCACAGWGSTDTAMFCQNVVESPDALMCDACNTGAIPWECPCEGCRSDGGSGEVPRTCHPPAVASAGATSNINRWQRMTRRSQRRKMRAPMRILVRIRIRLRIRRRMHIRSCMRLRQPTSTRATYVRRRDLPPYDHAIAALASADPLIDPSLLGLGGTAPCTVDRAGPGTLDRLRAALTAPAHPPSSQVIAEAAARSPGPPHNLAPLFAPPGRLNAHIALGSLRARLAPSPPRETRPAPCPSVLTRLRDSEPASTSTTASALIGQHPHPRRSWGGRSMPPPPPWSHRRSALTDASQAMAQHKTAAMLEGGGAMALSDASGAVTATMLAVEASVDFGVNANTRTRDERAWLLGEVVCASLGTSPLRTEEETRTRPERNALLLSVLLMYACAIGKPRSADRHVIRPKSALAHPLAIIRVFARWGIPRPPHKRLTAAVAECCRAYPAYHSPGSSAPYDPNLRSFLWCGASTTFPPTAPCRSASSRGSTPTATSLRFDVSTA